MRASEENRTETGRREYSRIELVIGDAWSETESACQLWKKNELQVLFLKLVLF